MASGPERAPTQEKLGAETTPAAEQSDSTNSPSGYRQPAARQALGSLRAPTHNKLVEVMTSAAEESEGTDKHDSAVEVGGAASICGTSAEQQDARL